MKNMKDRIKAGVWIDTKRAVIVTLSNNEERMGKVYSGIESRKRIAGEGKQYTRMGKQYFSFEKKEEEKRKHQQKRYFQQVMEQIIDVNDLIIMGPAAAKSELEKELLKSKAGVSIHFNVITTGRLTEKQIVAAIKRYFKNHAIHERNRL
jgi:stalled ribosome rescue protein Dom34